jgi:hypothetical protein
MDADMGEAEGLATKNWQKSETSNIQHRTPNAEF